MARFHGRNYEKWWRQERGSHERYSYEYGQPELEAWIPRIADVAEQTDTTYVFFNNHHLGRAAGNALDMRRLLAPLVTATEPELDQVGADDEPLQPRLF